MSLQVEVTNILKANHRSIGRALSLIEDGESSGQEILKEIFPHTGKANVIGITGSPGAGKSTLVDYMAKELSLAGNRVAIIAVDPSSPFSGGALLGDRIRMNNSLSEKNIFMRSMASRGALGGISLSTPDAIAVLDAAGFNYILVETVGVGQSEVEIVKAADSVIVVLVPGMGDSVQALKAGLLEIADTFVINKADYDGVERLEKELITMLGLGENSIRTPAILKSVASKGEGIKEILLEVDKHLAWSKQSGEIVKKREQFLLQAMKRNFAYLAENQLFQQPKNTKLIQENLEKLYQRKTTPYQAATLLLKKILYRPEK